MDFELIFKGKLQKIIAICIGIINIWIFYHLIGRSIWIDEGMILKNILESDSWLNFLHPLKYYDQAQPMLVSIFHYFVIHFMSLEIEFLRLSTFTLCVITSSPILYIIYKEKIGALIPALLFLGYAFSLGNYFTEIKHYGIEAAVSFCMIFLLYAYLSKKINFTYSIVLISLVTLLGFSTLIPAFVLIAFISFTEFQKAKKSFFNIPTLITLTIAGALGLLTFVHMQQLIVYQINNYTAYASEGLFGDIQKLVKVFRSVHGKDLAAVTMVLALAGLFNNFRFSVFRKNLWTLSSCIQSPSFMVCAV